MPAYVPPHLRRQQQQEAAPAPAPAPAPAALPAGQQGPGPEGAAPRRTFQTRGQGPTGDWHPLDEPRPAAESARAQRLDRQDRLQQPQPEPQPAPSAAAALPTAAAVQPVADLPAAVAALVASDDRVGFPSEEPGVDPNPHGWFFAAHRVVMSNLMNTETRCVLELGSWLGKSTRFIAERAPNAYLFAVDLWSNDHIRADPHYTDHGGESAFMAHKAARTRQIAENLKIIDTAPIYDVFLKNMWKERPAIPPAMAAVGGGAPGRAAGKGGVVPMKMCCKDGIEMLAQVRITIACLCHTLLYSANRTAQHRTFAVKQTHHCI